MVDHGLEAPHGEQEQLLALLQQPGLERRRVPQREAGEELLLVQAQRRLDLGDAAGVERGAERGAEVGDVQPPRRGPGQGRSPGA